MTYRLRLRRSLSGLATVSLLAVAAVACGNGTASDPLPGTFDAGSEGGLGANGTGGGGPGGAGGNGNGAGAGGAGVVVDPATKLRDTMLSRSTFGAHFDGTGRGIRPMVPGCGPDTAKQCGGQCEQQGGDPNVKVIRPPATLCFAGDGDLTPEDPAVVIEQVVERSGGKEYAHIRVTFDPSFVDNTYGEGSCCGWPVRRGHRYSDLVKSDHTELRLTDAAGATSMSFKVDYITESTTAACGYATLGVRGGDGAILQGDANHVLAAVTSLDRNLNYCGYCKSPACGPSGDCTVDSPATDENYTPNPATPAWDYRLVYEVWVDTAAFAGKGFGQAYVTYTHASPSKDQDTLKVQPTDCPKSWTQSPYCPPSVIAEGGNCFGVPTPGGSGGGNGSGTSGSGTGTGSGGSGTGTGTGTGGSGTGTGGSGTGTGGSGSGTGTGTGTGGGQCPISVILEGGDCSAYTGGSGTGTGGTGSGTGTSGSGTGTTGSGSGGGTGTGTTGSGSGGGTGTGSGQCPISVILEGGDCSAYTGGSGSAAGSGSTGGSTSGSGTGATTGSSSGGTSGSTGPNECPYSIVLEGGNCAGYYGTSGGFTGGTTGSGTGSTGGTGTTSGGTSASSGVSSGGTGAGGSGGGICAPNYQLYVTSEGASSCTPIPFANYPNFAACPSGYVLDMVSEGQYCLPAR